VASERSFPPRIRCGVNSGRNPEALKDWIPGQARNDKKVNGIGDTKPGE